MPVKKIQNPILRQDVLFVYVNLFLYGKAISRFELLGDGTTIGDGTTTEDKMTNASTSTPLPP